MDFAIADLTEEQKQIKALVNQFCKSEVDTKQTLDLADKAARAKTVEELRAIQPLDLLEKLHEVGLRQLAVPIKYGGGEADFLTRVIACEEAGYTGGMVGAILSTLWMYCSNMALEPVSEEQREWFYPQFMNNHTMFIAEATSEPQGTTDMHLGYDGPGGQMNTFAQKDGNEWVINGEKMFCSGGGVAELIIVLARTDKLRPLSQSMSFFWVRKDTPGMTMEMNEMISDLISGNVRINFDNVRVPETHLVGEVNKGFFLTERSAVMRMLPMVVMVGAARRLYEQMRDYASQRIQGGKPIIEHSNIARMLGEAAVSLESARTYMRRAAWENDQRGKAGLPVSLFWTEGARYLAKKMCWRLCEIAAEVYGGLGASLDMPVESFVRRTFRMLHTGNTTDINAIRCSKHYDDR